MKQTSKKTKVGRDEKSDVVVELTPAKSGGLRVTLESSVKDLFGEQIERTVLNTLQALGVQHAQIHLQDNGALDFVIQARIEAAARQAGHVVELERSEGRKKKGFRDRLRRTRLYLPGNNPDLMINAGLFAADCLILDLEDSVAPSDKFAARILVRNALIKLDFGASERIVRINPLSSPFGKEDLEMIVPALPDTLLIPKCETAKDVLAVDRMVTELEKKARVSAPLYFMPLIESAKGVWHAFEIASASPRNVALCFGAEDFTADIGAERTVEGTESFVAKSLVLLAAKAAGLQAIDTVFSDVQDMEGLVAGTQ
ncbi:citrate lyase acyl carrier protein, partial [candidate division KSB1 bacterium]|nr:citrate lyase acyl carrier protein [candidate division KSB1 bacterium]